MTTLNLALAATSAFLAGALIGTWVGIYQWFLGR